MHIHHSLYFLKNRELDEIYLSIAIRSFAISSIDIFIPIFLLKLGYSIAEVLMFFAIVNITHALFVFPSIKISVKYGFKHSILFSIPLLILFYMLLFMVKLWNLPLYLLAILFGVSNSLFWMGYHVDFSFFSNMKWRGREIGTAQAVSLIFTVLGPLVGGIILSSFGFKVLFLLVALMLLFSSLPLFFSEDIKGFDIKIKDLWGESKFRDIISLVSRGAETGISMVIWPIFVFFYILNNYFYLGAVSSLFTFFTLFSIIFVAKISDRCRRLTLRIGAVMNSIVWVLRTFIRTMLQVVFIDSFYGITQTFIKIPFDALSYDKAESSNTIGFIALREIMIQIGRTLVYLIASFIPIKESFLIGAFASLLYFLF